MLDPETRGKFIVIEGPDGSGKTRVVQELQKLIPGIHCTREPSDGPIGTFIRAEYLNGDKSLFPMGLQMMYAADRIDHLTNPENGIAKILSTGTTVITDRYYMSSMVCFALSTHKSTEMFLVENYMKWIYETCNHYAMAKFRPDLTVVLNVHADELIRRRDNRDEYSKLFESTEEIKRQVWLYDMASKICKRAGENVVQVNGSVSPNQVALQIALLLKTYNLVHAEESEGDK